MSFIVQITAQYLLFVGCIETAMTRHCCDIVSCLIAHVCFSIRPSCRPARCPFSTSGAPNPHTASVTDNTCSSVCGESCNLCGVTMALAVIPLGAIGYYDPKIALTTLVIMIVLSVLRRIFRMIASEENSCCSA